jgi:hypothetical protein
LDQIKDLADRYNRTLERVRQELAAVEHHAKAVVQRVCPARVFVQRWALFRESYQRIDDLEEELVDMRSKYSDLCQELGPGDFAEAPNIEWHIREVATMSGIELLARYSHRILMAAQCHVAEAMNKRATLLASAMKMPEGPEREKEIKQMKSWETRFEERSRVIEELVSAMNVAQAVVSIAGLEEY